MILTNFKWVLGESISLLLVFLSLEKTVTNYKFYYLFVFCLAFFITIEGKGLQLFVLSFLLFIFQIFDYCKIIFLGSWESDFKETTQKKTYTKYISHFQIDCTHKRSRYLKLDIYGVK